MSNSCLIIGAGLTGLSAADVLSASGWQVVLLDKGRHAGGRMATRRLGESRFDYGAQFFTVRDSRFQKAVDSWQARGLVTPWFTNGPSGSSSGSSFGNGDHIRYRGIRGMRGIAECLGTAFELRTSTLVTGVQPVDGNWRATTDAGEVFAARYLLLTMPAPQAVAVLSSCIDSLPAALVSSLRSVAYDPCFALLVITESAARIPHPGYLRPGDGPLAFLADNTQKGISSGPPALTIHATADFTRSHFDLPASDVTRLMLQAAQPWLGSQPLQSYLHRWRYSQASAPLAEPCLFASQPAPVAIAGDGFGAARIEGAFLSGLAAAERILADSRSCRP